MRFKIAIFAFSLALSNNVLASEAKKITKADANDYMDCAAFYASVIASLTTLGTLDQARSNSLKERTNFYLSTAKIYNGVTDLTPEMKTRFLSTNKEYISSSYIMLKDKNKDLYSNFVDTRILECKEMLNINSQLLMEKQGIGTK